MEEKEEKQTIDVEKFLEELDLRDKQNQKPVETPLTTFVKQRREDRRVSSRNNCEVGFSTQLVITSEHSPF